MRVVTAIISVVFVTVLASGCGSSDSEPWVVYQWGAPCAQEAPGAGLCLTRSDGTDAHAILADVPGTVVDLDGAGLKVVDGLWSTHPREQP